MRQRAVLHIDRPVLTQVFFRPFDRQPEPGLSISTATDLPPPVSAMIQPREHQMRQGSDRRDPFIRFQFENFEPRQMLPHGRDRFVADVVAPDRSSEGELDEVLGNRPGTGIAHIVVAQIERGELAQVLGNHPGAGIAHLVVAQIERSELAEVLGDRPGADLANFIAPQIERSELAEVLGDRPGAGIAHISLLDRLSEVSWPRCSAIARAPASPTLLLHRLSEVSWPRCSAIARAPASPISLLAQVERSELAEVLGDRPGAGIANLVARQVERSELAEVLGDRPGAGIAHIVVAQIERGELVEVLGDCGSVLLPQAEKPQSEDLQPVESQQLAGQLVRNSGQLIHNTTLKYLGPVVR